MALFPWENEVRKTLMTALALGAVAVPAIAPAQVQTVPVQVPLISGTRLDVTEEGDESRSSEFCLCDIAAHAAERMSK